MSHGTCELIQSLLTHLHQTVTLTMRSIVLHSLAVRALETRPGPPRRLVHPILQPHRTAGVTVPVAVELVEMPTLLVNSSQPESTKVSWGGFIFPSGQMDTYAPVALVQASLVPQTGLLDKDIQARLARQTVSDFASAWTVGRKNFARCTRRGLSLLGMIMHIKPDFESLY